jgi:DNA polymerase III alpha subunit
MLSTLPAPPDYAELFCRSNFSFLHGASTADELVERAVALRYRGLAITDECSLAGAVRMHVAAKAAGLPLVVGAYFEVTPDEDGQGFGLVLLARDRDGYGNLSELISWLRMRAPKGTYRLARQELAAPPEAFAHLRGMPGCFAVLVPRYPATADQLCYEYPREIVPPGHTPATYLAQETWKGAQARYPYGVPGKVRERIEYELTLIADLKYEAYFLTVYDIVSYARSRDILCQGRGSAANSVVCYCLRVTEVDPERSTLLFERFISRERGEPPDIDVYSPLFSTDERHACLPAFCLGTSPP